MKTYEILTIAYEYISINVRRERRVFMSITATELKENLGKYLQMASTEDIFITKNGHVIAKLTSPYQDLVATAKSLAGIIPADITVEEAREERLSRI